jgi:hypothetical protein
MINCCALSGYRVAARSVSPSGSADPPAYRSCSLFHLTLLLLLPVHALVAEQTTSDDAAQDIDHVALESNGARIGNVSIEVGNIFDTDDPEEDRALYRFANRINFKTRDAVIEDLLLFDSGDRFESRLLDESARLLRARPYLAEATVRTNGYDEQNNTADISVFVRDAWSFQPELRFSRNGGENEYRLGLTDSNLLGTGKGLTVYYNSDVDRNESYLRYVDPNVRGSRARLDLTVADTSDGERQLFGAERPFFALDTRWSAGGMLQKEKRIDSMYDLGEIVDEFRHDIRIAEVRGGYSRGLNGNRATRWLAGITSDERRFAPTAEVPDPLLLPEDRKLVYPWVGMQLIVDDFREMTELNDMGRVEDVPLGLDLTLILGYSTTSLGADRDATIARLLFSQGWEPGGTGRLLLLGGDATGRWEGGRLRNSLIQASANYYQRNLERHLFLVSLNATSSHALDGEQQVLLGGDTGLRGYPLRYQAGRHKAVLTVEQRFHTDLYPWRLFRVGYAAFFDAGRIWGQDPRATAGRGTLYDVGVGLRLTSPRSSSGTVIHIDLALPLNRDGDIRSTQLLFEAKQSF